MTSNLKIYIFIATIYQFAWIFYIIVEAEIYYYPVTDDNRFALNDTVNSPIDGNNKRKSNGATTDCDAALFDWLKWNYLWLVEICLYIDYDLLIS